MAIIEEHEINCYEAIRNVDDAMRSSLVTGQEYYVLGGIATAAIRDARSEIDHDNRTIIADETSAESVIRPNGTKRDIDILVRDVLSPEAADLIKCNVQEAVNNTLVVSVFGVDRHNAEATVGSRFKSSVADWISRRTIDDEGIMRYELAPLVQEVAGESYEPWTLITPHYDSVRVLSPAGHVLAYAMRSISGVRAKDAEKMDGMLSRVLADEQFRTDIKQGPFRSWLDFALAIQELRDGRLATNSPMLNEGTGLVDRAAFRAKSKMLSALEGNTKIVNFAQSETIQKILNIFVRAK